MTESLEKADNGRLNSFVSIYKSGSGSKIISRLYKSFPDFLKANAQLVKDKLEREGVMVISEDGWGNHRSQWITTSPHILREFE